jgi:hypothetical protein
METSNAHDRGEARQVPHSERAQAIEEWRRGRDSNPRAGYPTRRFRGAPVTTTSVPLRVGVRVGPLLRMELAEQETGTTLGSAEAEH